ARVDAALEDAARGGMSSARTPRLLLILQRLPDADAAPRLARFVDDVRHPPALRAEVAGWGVR
ncbi:MAG TPA: hypothetical protein VJM11_05345, partial [Nevskiaceae bacterium]|nr:hypothetical protein [Nevskiaceae bacterium]